MTQDGHRHLRRPQATTRMCTHVYATGVELFYILDGVVDLLA